MKLRALAAATAAGLLIITAGPASSQTAAPAVASPAARATAPGGAATETWWIQKEKGGVWPGPGKPLWRLADAKQKHAGQANWREVVVNDGRQTASYNSAAPGAKFIQRMDPTSQTMFVVLAGKVKFTVEGQPEITAVRGSIVNVLEGLVFSYEALPGENALWIEVTPDDINYLYPVALPAPPPVAGKTNLKVSFGARNGEYKAPNQPHWNLFEAVAKCDLSRAGVADQHLYATAIIAYANPADNKCSPAGGSGGGRGNEGPTAAQLEATALGGGNFGHLHSDMAEWWIIQSGAVTGQFAGQKELHAVEGDILYAPRMTWHQMGVEGPGVSTRLAITAFPFINMNYAKD